MSVKTILQNKSVKQALGLLSVNVITIPLGIVTSIIITRYLGIESYGNYKFIASIFDVFMIVFIAGFFQAGNRAIVLTNNNKSIREYYGSELIILFGTYIIMSLAMVVYTILDPNIIEKGVQRYLYMLIPFGWIYLLYQYFEILLPANNKIKLLASARLLPKVGYCLVSGILYYSITKSSTDKLMLIYIGYLLTQVIVYIYLLYRLKISFANCKKRLKEIVYYNRTYGFNVYLSSLFAVGFASLTGVLISYFGFDNVGVGYYSLAIVLSTPLSFIPNTIATTKYRDFVNYNKIPSKLLYGTFSACIGTLICLWLIVPPFVHYFYGVAFTPVIQLNFIISIGMIAHGLADFYNRYLGAKGQSKYMRNSSFYVAAALMTFNLMLIPAYGAHGAAYARLISSFVYLITIIWYYMKYTDSISKSTDHNNNDTN